MQHMRYPIIENGTLPEEWKSDDLIQKYHPVAYKDPRFDKSALIMRFLIQPRDQKSNEARDEGR
jgi:hypothetical protein